MIDDKLYESLLHEAEIGSSKEIAEYAFEIMDTIRELKARVVELEVKYADTMGKQFTEVVLERDRWENTSIKYKEQVGDLVNRIQKADEMIELGRRRIMQLEGEYENNRQDCINNAQHFVKLGMAMGFKQAAKTCRAIADQYDNPKGSLTNSLVNEFRRLADDLENLG